MTISKFQHVFDTWAYPRVYHFERQFRDVHKRFINVINNGPHQFLFKPKREIYDQMLLLRDMLEKPLEVNVFGKNNIDKGDMVLSSEEPQQPDSVQKYSKEKKVVKVAKKSTIENGLTVVVLHVELKDTDEKGIKKVMAVVNDFQSKYSKKMSVSADAMILLCKPKTNADQSKLDLFQQRVQHAVKETFELELSLSQIVLIKDKQILSTLISQMFESKVIEGFNLMKTHMKGFVKGVSHFSMEKVDVVETTKLVNALQGFLKNGLGFVDILEDSRSKGISFEEVLKSNIVRVIRCAVLETLSMKFDLAQDVCNQIAFELNLDVKMKENISRNTRFHLSKIEKHAIDLENAIKHGHKWYSFPSRDFLFIAFPLRDDIKGTIQVFEKHLAALQNHVFVMKKMMFEINGNIKESQFAQEDISIPKCPTDLPELKKNLFEIKGVYGIGRIYGEWEIHVEDENAEQSVKDLIADYRIKYPVRIRRVIDRAKPLAGGQLEHGIALETRSSNDPVKFQSGTLGIFLDSPDDDLYAMTCGHVVNVSDGRDNEVYVSDWTGQRKVLGTSSPSRTVLTGSLPTRLVDLAAVKVRDSLVPDCTKFIKDDDGMLKNPELALERRAQLAAQYVFKYGAASNLTKGIICCDDYSLGPLSDQYVILIAPQPDVNPIPYARPGDSGSVICTRDIDKNRVVKVVSMLSAGELVLQGQNENFSISFELSTGLDGLKNMPSGLRLQVPSEASGRAMF